MTDADETTSDDRREREDPGAGDARDDRRRAVNPAESPVPQSPAPDEQAVRDGEEKLDRL